MLLDLYEFTMSNGILHSKERDKLCYFDMFFRRVPDDGGFAIMAGLEQLIEYFNDLKFTDEDIEYLRSLKIFGEDFLEYLRDFKFCCDVWSVSEGTPIFPGEPIITVRGPAMQAFLVETMVLLCVNHQSLIATKANRIVRAADGRPVMEFGARRAHGASAAIYGARAAIIGGCSSTSNVLAGQLYDVAIAGTHAHSWVMSFPTELDAFRAYAEIFPDSCMLLVDTYDTLKSGVPNAIKVFDELRAKGHKPVGIRLDSGDLAYFSKEARRMLDAAGYQDARIFASSDLDEYVIRELKAQGARIDVWGVGTKMITSYDWPALGGVYKMSAEIVDGKMTPKIKISENPAKLTNPGYKKIYRLYSRRDNMALADIIALDDETIDDSKPIKLYNQHHTYQTKVIRDFYARELLVPVFMDGRQVYESPDVCSIREYSKKELAAFWEEYRRILNPHTYKVDISDKLYNLKMELIHENREEYEQEDC